MKRQTNCLAGRTNYTTIDTNDAPKEPLPQLTPDAEHIERVQHILPTAQNERQQKLARRATRNNRQRQTTNAS